LAGAALYVLLPFHLLDVYDRFALAQFLAFIWLPPLFRLTRDLAERPSGWLWLGLVASYAGLVLTHLPTAFLVPLTLGPFALVLVARSGSWSRLAPISGAGVTALVCCAFYLIPMLAERDLIHSEWIAESFWGDWRRNFAFSDEVALGYTPARIKPWVERSLASTAALAGVAAILLALRRRGGNDGGGAAAWSPAYEAGTYVGLAAWTIVLQTPLSTPLWAFVPELGSVQFPWRYGVQLTLFACLAVSCALAPLAVNERLRGALDGLPPTGRLGLALGAVVLVSVPALVTSAALPGLRAWDLDATRAELWGRGGREYVPAGTWFPPRDAPILPDAVLLDGGSLRVEAWTTHARVVLVESPTGARVRLRTFEYPGWEARVDGQPAPIERTEGLGTIEVAVPPGSHRLDVRFASTPLRQRAAALSLAALLLLATAAAVIRYRLRGRPQAQ
jgi:hypothetical protein